MRSHQSKVQLPWHAWHGGRLTWKRITENDSCFSRFVGAVPSPSPPPSSGTSHQPEKNVSGGWLSLSEKQSERKMNTNTCKRCSWHAQACVWGENNTCACKKAYFMRKSTWNSMAITQYGKYELDSEHLCQIVLTSIQHTWLICPSQFPSWLGEGLQRTKLRRSHDMLQS